jgi:hypothetical protein
MILSHAMLLLWCTLAWPTSKLSQHRSFVLVWFRIHLSAVVYVRMFTTTTTAATDITCLLSQVLWNYITSNNSVIIVFYDGYVFGWTHPSQLHFSKSQSCDSAKECLFMWHIFMKETSFIIFPIRDKGSKVSRITGISPFFVCSHFSFRNICRFRTLVVMSAHCMSVPVRLI